MANPLGTAALTQSLKREAQRLGFDLAGVCPAVEPSGLTRFHEWLASGYAGEMTYLAERRDAYAHPRHVLDGVRSLLMLSMNYDTASPAVPGPTEGRVSRYAWGTDYHDTIHERLKRLAVFLREQVPGVRVRGVVDTAPLMEREFARLAGLGWLGKNTLLLNKQRGSWFFLAALLTDAELAYDQPHASDHCGTCRACLDACPTGALFDEYVLDATRCISYLTIELRSAIPEGLRQGVGEWLFGCDICQEVCPWNGSSTAAGESGFRPRDDLNAVELPGLFSLDEAAFRQRFRHSPLWRAKRRGLLRNAAIVLGNGRDPRALPALLLGLKDDEPLVRGACAWALARFRESLAAKALARQARLESDAGVRREIEAALKDLAEP